MRFFFYAFLPFLLLYVVVRHPQVFVASCAGRFGGLVKWLMVAVIAWTLFLVGLLVLGFCWGWECREPW